MRADLTHEELSLARCNEGTYLLLEWGYLTKLPKPIDAIIMTFLKNKYRSLRTTYALTDGWFFCTGDEMAHWTGISYKSQRESVNRLIELGFIQTSMRGLPAKRNFKIDWEKLNEIEGINPQSIPKNDIKNEAKSTPETEFLGETDWAQQGETDWAQHIKRNTLKRNTLLLSKESRCGHAENVTTEGLPFIPKFEDENNPDSTLEETQGTSTEENNSIEYPRNSNISQPYSVYPKSKISSPTHSKSKNNGTFVPSLSPPKVSKDVLSKILDLSPHFSKLKWDISSQVFQRIEKLLLQIAFNSFIHEYKWKDGWMTDKLKTYKKFPGARPDGILPWDSVISLISISVTAWHASIESGLDWPKKKPNGTRERVSLSAFLLNQAPNGTTSPFLGFLIGARQKSSHLEIKDFLPLKVQEIAQEILDVCTTQKGKVWGTHALERYWKGVSNLMMWRRTNEAQLLKDDFRGGNGRHLTGAGRFMAILKEYYIGSNPMFGSAGFLGWDFMVVDAPEWKAFAKWANINFDITLIPKFKSKLTIASSPNAYNSPEPTDNSMS